MKASGWCFFVISSSLVLAACGNTKVEEIEESLLSDEVSISAVAETPSETAPKEVPSAPKSWKQITALNPLPDAAKQAVGQEDSSEARAAEAENSEASPEAQPSATVAERSTTGKTAQEVPAAVGSAPAPEPEPQQEAEEGETHTYELELIDPEGEKIYHYALPFGENCYFFSDWDEGIAWAEDHTFEFMDQGLFAWAGGDYTYDGYRGIVIEWRP